MAPTWQKALSSSPTNMSSPSSSSSSYSSTTINLIDDTVNDTPYRRKEVIDGNVVRIMESRRRRRDESHSKPVAGNRTTNASSNKCRNDYWRCTEAAGQSPIIVQDVQSSPKLPVPSQPLRRPATEGSRKARGNAFELSKNGDEMFFRHSSPLTPPPTPRIQRLPTPELESLKERRFCDCCNRFGLTAAHECSDLKNPNEAGLWW